MNLFSLSVELRIYGGKQLVHFAMHQVIKPITLVSWRGFMSYPRGYICVVIFTGIQVI